MTIDSITFIEVSSFLSLQKGNQAEWIQVVISTIGLGFIIWTLRSQLNVTKIEQERFKQDNVPIVRMITTKSGGDDVIKMQVDNHVGDYNIKIQSSPEWFLLHDVEHYNVNGLLKGSIVNWKYSIDGHKYNRLEAESTPVNMEILYSDLHQNYYRQEISLFLNGEGMSFKPVYIGTDIDITTWAKK